MVNVGSFEDRVARALVQGGFIAEAQVDQARKQGGDLLETLVSMRFIGRESLITALSLQLRVPVVDLKQMQVDPEAVKLLPEQYARQHRVLP
ncbi:MAG: MSHA biogenesis protein MshE, partial [Chloroflexota bacterium]